MDSTKKQTQSGKKKVQVGDLAPDFTLPSQNGTTIHLKDLLGKTNIVLYFYPKDESPACTTQACSFRDSYEEIKEAGAQVLGVSSDSVESHQRFAAKNRLTFPLLSDTNGELRKHYGVATTLGMLPGRVTYIIDKQGIVRHIFSSQFSPDKHVPAALKILSDLNKDK